MPLPIQSDRADAVDDSHKMGRSTFQKVGLRRTGTIRRSVAIGPSFRASRGIAGATRMNNYKKVIKSMQTPEYHALMDKAYSSKGGYAIGKVRGEKVMAVAGSRSWYDWKQNWIERKGPHENANTRREVKKLDEVAASHGVSAVYGHSRGGKLVADMKGSYGLIGADAAMRNTNNKRLMNINSGSTFDTFLGKGGRRNHRVRGTQFHSIWKEPWKKGIWKSIKHLPKEMAEELIKELIKEKLLPK